MKIRKTINRREMYRESQLNLPTESMNLPYFIQRLRRFSRDSILQIGSFLLWKQWQSHNSRDSGSAETIIVYQAFYVMAFAAIYCAPKGRRDALERDVIILCNELFHCDDTIIDENWKKNIGMPEIRNSIANSGSDRLKKIQGDDDFNLVLLEHFLSRTIRMQWDLRVYSKTLNLRQILIYQHFRKIASTRNDFDLTKVERSFFGTTYERFLRSANVLFAIAQQGNGFINFDALDLDFLDNGDNFKSLDIKETDLRMVAHRLSIPISSLSIDRVKINGLNLHTQRTAIVERLKKNPLLDLDAPQYSKSFSKLAALNPWALNQVAKRYLMTDFFDFMRTEYGVEEAPSMRGEAFENYLIEILKNTKVRKIDAIPNYVGKRPDFEWIGKDHEIFIECKYALIPNSDPENSSISTAIQIWKRAEECIDQAAEYISANRFRASGKQKILAIVVHDSLKPEIEGFVRVASNWKFLENTRIDAIIFLLPDEIEHFSLFWDPDKFGQLALQSWAGEPKWDGVSTEIYDTPALPHIKAAWDWLFPPLKGQYPFP